MAMEKTQAEKDQLDREIEEMRRQGKLGYREQALKLYPWICAKCARSFTGKNLRELTVHHKDHNHDNNPSDGSNWELLCLYCHDNEHARYLDGPDANAQTAGATKAPTSTHNPFANLAGMLKDKK